MSTKRTAKPRKPAAGPLVDDYTRLIGRELAEAQACLDLALRAIADIVCIGGEAAIFALEALRQVRRADSVVAMADTFNEKAAAANDKAGAK